MTELEPPRRSRRRVVIGAVAAVALVVATVLVVQRRANEIAAVEEAIPFGGQSRPVERHDPVADHRACGRCGTCE